MNYLFALFVVTALEGGDYKYTHIKTYDDRMKCEIEASVFVAINEPFQDNENVFCLKVDE